MYMYYIDGLSISLSIYTIICIYVYIQKVPDDAVPPPRGAEEEPGAT